MLAQVVLIIALILILVGVIMVILDAFKESFFWGLIVLLIPPIFVPVYSFVKWNKYRARNGFAMALVGLFMAGIGVYGGGLLGLPGVEDHEIVSNIPLADPNEPLSNEEEAAAVNLENEEDYDPILSTDKDRYSSSEIDPLAPKGDKSVKNFASNKVNVVNVPLDNLGTSVGAIVEVTMNDGAKHTGILTSTTNDTLFLEQYAGAGTVGYEYNVKKVKSVVRFTRPGR